MVEQKTDAYFGHCHKPTMELFFENSQRLSADVSHGSKNPSERRLHTLWNFNFIQLINNFLESEAVHSQCK